MANVNKKSKSITLVGKSKDEQYKIVKKFIKNQGDKLLDKKYVNAKTKMRIKCGECKKIFSMEWSNYFSGGQRCPIRALQNKGKIRLISFEKTKIQIENNTKLKHIQVLGFVGNEWNGKSLLKLYCDVHKLEFKKSRINLLISYGCKKCGSDSCASKTKIPVESAKRRCNKMGFELLSLDYRNIYSYVKVKCLKYGHITKHQLWSIFDDKTKCKYCGGSKPERKVQKILDKLVNKGILLKYEKSVKLSEHYDGDPMCKYIRESVFDFLVTLPNKYTFVIEVDGLQHFEGRFYLCKPNGEFRWLEQKYKDTMKTRHCRNNKITLLRIHEKDLPRTKYCLMTVIDAINGRGVDSSYVYYSDLFKYKQIIGRLDRKKYQKPPINSLKKAK